MRKLYGDKRERMNFKLMCEAGNVPAPDAPWMYIVHTDIPDHIVEDIGDLRTVHTTGDLPGAWGPRHLAGRAEHPCTRPGGRPA